VDWIDEIRDEDDGRAASATDPAMDARTFSKVVEGQADRLVELAKAARFTVEQLIKELENGDEHLPLSSAVEEAEHCIDELAGQVDDIEAHVAGLVDHGRALVDLYCDEAGHRSRRCRGRSGRRDVGYRAQ
jgi:hypothetical protein